MTIRTILDGPWKDMEFIHYSGVSFQNSLEKPVLYDENPTPIQKRIEMNITGGKGYLSLQESLDFVNNSESIYSTLKLSLPEVLSKGLIPIYFKEEEMSKFNRPQNHCGEIPLGNYVKCSLPISNEPKTFVEELRMVQYVKAHSKGRFRPEGIKTFPGSYFDPKPILIEGNVL